MASMDESWLVSLALLLLPVFSLWLLKQWGRRDGSGRPNLPPSPPRLPIIGNLHQLEKLKHLSLYKLSQKYGPIMLLRLGSAPTIVISSAAMAKEVMKTHDTNCCSRPASPGPKKLSYDYLDVALSPYDDYWKEIRKIYTSEIANPKRAQLLSLAREDEITYLINTITQSFRKPVVLDGVIFPLMDGVFSAFAFGKSYRGKQFRNQSFSDVIGETMKVLDSFTAEDFFPSVGWIVDAFSGNRARLDKCFLNLDSYFQTMIEEHLDPKRPAPEIEDLIDVLLRISKEQSGSLRLTPDHIKAIIMDTFIAGVDTNAITIIWAMAELIKNPRVMKKVQAEIRNTVGQKARVTESDNEKLKYLKMVAKETLRLHPPTRLLIPRETLGHFKVDGYDIYPKTRILINVWAIHRDPESWKNPLEFNPERFENSGIDFKGQHFELLPFGSGRRICPAAATMGTATVEMVLANLLHQFDWQLPDGMKREDLSMEEDGGLTVNKKVPLTLVPVKHDWSM